MSTWRMQEPHRLLGHLAVACVACLLSLPARSQISPALDAASLSVGAFTTNPGFTASLNTRYGTLQSGDIDLGEKTLPRLKGEIILFGNQGLSLDVYQYINNYGASTRRTAQLVGNAVNTAASANFGLQLDLAKLAYTWWLGSGNSVLGLGLGAAYYRISMRAQARLSINNATASIDGDYRDETLAPLAEMGLRHAIRDDLRLYASASGVRKWDGPLTGEIYNAAIGAQWLASKNLALALEYGWHQLDLRRDDPLAERFKVRMEGPTAYLTFRF